MGHERQQPSTRSSRIYIIGHGVFGLSLHRYITIARPTDEVIAFDSCEKGSAVKDTHKIVRVRYASRRRTEVAREAQQEWKVNPAFQPFYHPIGRFEITDDGPKLEAIDANLHEPRQRYTEQFIAEYLKTSNPSSEERRTLEFLAGLLKTANDPTLHCVWNRDDAVVDWGPCIQELRKPLQSKIREVKVDKLIVGDASRICGLQLEHGEIVAVADGDSVIMTPGAWGETLLEKSSISAPLKRSRAIGVFTFHLKLDDSHREYLKGLPALTFQTTLINCEFLPPLPETDLVKVGLTLPFTNQQNEPQDVAETPLMYFALLLVLQWVRKYYPGLTGSEIVGKEGHWDAVTEDQTPLISWHPDHKNLAIGWGASYTRAKDLPTIGQTIYDILFGTPSEEFGWNSTLIEDRVQHNQPLLLTNKLFSDLNEDAAMNKEVQVLMKQGIVHYI